jgi:hypothetical protein
VGIVLFGDLMRNFLCGNEDGGKSFLERDLEIGMIFYLLPHGDFVPKFFIKIPFINIYLSTL